MSRISDFLSPGTPSVVAPATRSEAYVHSTSTGSFWNEFQGQAEVLLGSILRAKAADGTPARSIGVTSLYRHEGVSTIVAALGHAAATQRNTLLIDANWQHPKLAEMSGVSAPTGFLQVLAEESPPMESIHPLHSRLSIMTAGRTSSAKGMTIAADRFQWLIEELSQQYELILVDLPAVRETSSVFEMCGVLDGVALVVEAEKVHWQAGQRELTRLRQAGVHLLGAVLNKRRDYIPGWLYRML